MKTGKYVWKVKETGLSGLFGSTISTYTSPKEANRHVARENKRAGHRKYHVVKYAI